MRPSGQKAAKQHQSVKDTSAWCEEIAASDRTPARSLCSAVWHHTRPLLGIATLILGAVGIVIPILPGIPLLLAGVALLGQNHPIVRVCTAWIGRRCPRFSLSRRRLCRGHDLAGD